MAWASHGNEVLSKIHSDYILKKYKAMGHKVNQEVEYDVAIFMVTVWRECLQLANLV